MVVALACIQYQHRRRILIAWALPAPMCDTCIVNYQFPPVICVHSLRLLVRGTVFSHQHILSSCIALRTVGASTSCCVGHSFHSRCGTAPPFGPAWRLDGWRQTPLVTVACCAPVTRLQRFAAVKHGWCLGRKLAFRTVPSTSSRGYQTRLGCCDSRRTSSGASASRFATSKTTYTCTKQGLKLWRAPMVSSVTRSCGPTARRCLLVCSSRLKAFRRKPCRLPAFPSPRWPLGEHMPIDNLQAHVESGRTGVSELPPPPAPLALRPSPGQERAGTRSAQSLPISDANPQRIAARSKAQPTPGARIPSDIARPCR